MTIEIYALSVLRRGPVHGYELKRRVRRQTIAAVHNNTLYPALRRLEQAGAVPKTVVAQEGRPPRNVYELTPRGRELLRSSSRAPAGAGRGREEFLVRGGPVRRARPAGAAGRPAGPADVVQAALVQERSLRADAAPPGRAAPSQEQLVRGRRERELLWIAALGGSGADMSLRERRRSSGPKRVRSRARSARRPGTHHGGLEHRQRRRAGHRRELPQGWSSPVGRERVPAVPGGRPRADRLASRRLGTMRVYG